MSFLVRFFGTSAATPSLNRGFACIGVVNKKDSGEEAIILLDCGDGSIHKIVKANTNCLSISDIFITHFHSDHLSGLAQVVESMGIEKRTKDLNVYAPKGLKEYFSQVEITTRVASKRRFEIKIHELDNEKKVVLPGCTVTGFSMQHTIPCLGYRLESSDFILAYTGDTEPCENVLSLSKDSDILVHEATFLAKDEKKARESKHSTPSEAAKLADKAKTGKLILTHINDKYETEDEILTETNPIFNKTKIAYDGLELML